MTKRNQASFGENETILDRTINSDLEKAINKIHSGKGKKINKVREEKLYREKYGTFGEYVKNEHGVERTYGQRLAQVARFCDITGNYKEEVSSMSYNSKHQFVINHNKRAKEKREEQYSSKFTPLIEQVIRITVDANDDKVKMNPKIVNACDAVITEFLNAENLEYDDDETEKVAKKLKENHERLVSICKERLKIADTSKITKTCKHFREIISIKKNLLTLKCGCVFRLNN